MSYRSAIKTFLGLAALQAVNYSLLVWNFRVVAHGDVILSMVSDGVCATSGIFVIQQTAKATSWVARAGIIVGGIAGSGLAVTITKHFLHY